MARLMAGGSSSPNLGGSSSNLPVIPTRSDSSVKLGRAANNMASRLPSLRESIESIAAGEPVKQKGIVPAVLGNPVVGTVLNALNVASIPGRAIVAGLGEVKRELDSDFTQDASWSNFVKNVKNPAYGFGTEFAKDMTGNKWVDRAIGFVGDLVLDPTTYMTFGGSKFAGYAGRLDLAREVLKLTDDAALANKVQQFGRSAVKDAEILERAGANRHGLYLLGHRTGVGKMSQGLRIPGTGAIGLLGDKTLTKVRTWSMGTRMGKTVQRLGLDPNGLPARQALLQGNVGDDAAAALISYFTSDPLARRIAGQTLAEESSKVLNTLTQERAKGLDGYGKMLGDLIESEEAFNAATPQMQRAAQVWIDLFGGYENNIVEMLKTIDPTIDPKTRFRERYLPRIFSDNALDYMGDASNTHSGALREVYSRDPMGGGRNFKSRTLEVGDTFFGHKLTLKDLEKTSNLNEIAKKAGFDGDFFETDMGKIVDRYVQEYSKEVGALTRHKHLLDTGFWKYAEAVEVGAESIDEVLVQSVKKNIKSLDDELATLSKQTAEHMRAMSTNLQELAKSLAKNLGEAQKTLDDFESYGSLANAIDGVLSGNAQLTLDQIELIGEHLGAFKQKFAQFMGGEYKAGKLVAKAGQGVDDTPKLAEGFLGYLDNLQRDMLESHEEIARLTVNAEGAVLKADIDEALARLKSVEARFARANERLQMVFQFGNAIEQGAAKMASGEAFMGGSQEVQHVLALIARDGSVTTDLVKEIIDEQFNVAGALQDFLSSWVNVDGGIFKELTINAGLKNTDLSKYTASDFYELMYRVHNARINPDDIRIGALFALASDERIYAGKIPEAVQQMRGRLIAQLKRMDEAIAYSRFKSEEIARGTKSNSAQIFETQVKAKYEEILSLQETLVGLTRFLDEVVPKLEATPGALDTPFDVEDLRVYLKKYPELEEFIGTEGEDWADLMGVNDINLRGGRGVANVEDMPEQAAPKYFFTEQRDLRVMLGGENQIPETVARSDEFITGQTTFAELIDAVNKKVSTINGLMDNPVYGFTTGVTEQARYTGRELVARYEEYVNLTKEIAGLKRTQREFIEDFKVQRGFYTIDDSTPIGRAKRESLQLEAETAALTRNYDEAYTMRLRSEGYFKTDDPVKRRSIEAKVNADLDAIRSREPAGRILLPEEKAVPTPKGMSFEEREAFIMRLRNEGYFKTTDPAERSAIETKVKSAIAKEKAASPSLAPGAKGPRIVNAPNRKGRVSYGDRFTELKSRLDELSGGGSMVKPAWFDSLEREQSKLVNSLMDYAVVSEVHSRAKAVSGIYSAMGMVPTESMFGMVVGGVASKFIPRVESRIQSVYLANEILSRMDVEIARRIGDKEITQSASQVFKDVLASLSSRERGILEDVVGKEIGWATDPYDLRVRLNTHLKGKNSKSVGPQIGPDGAVKVDKNGKPIAAASERTIAENEFFEQHVKPWFQNAYPKETYSKQAAKNKLKQLAPSRAKNLKSAMTPFSEDADPAVIKAWFETLIGRSEVKGSSASAKLGTYVGVGPDRTFMPTVGGGDPVLTRRLKELKSARSRMQTMTAPDLDIGAFLDNPGMSQRTPTWYAHVMQTHADELDDIIAAKQAANRNIVDARNLVTARNQRIDEARGAVEGFRSAPERIAQLESDIVTLQNSLKSMEDGTQSALIPGYSKKKIQESIAEKRKEIKELEKLPRRIDDVITSAEKKSKDIAEATLPAAGLESQLDELAGERDTLIARSRTKSGLNKTEQKRLASVRKRINKLRDEVKAIRDAGPKGLTEREAKVFDIPANKRNVRGANEIIDEYNEMMGSPLYAKARADREIVDAISGLAGFDLHRYVDGFTSDGIAYATMPDGSRLTFKEEEWMALFTPNMTGAEIRANRAEINQLVLDLNEENKILSARIPQLQAYVDGIDESLITDVAPPGLSRQFKIANEVRTELQNSIARVESNGETITQLRVRADSMLSANRKAGLEKMRILVHGNTPRGSRASSPIIFDSFGLSRFVDLTHPSHRGIGSYKAPAGSFASEFAQRPTSISDVLAAKRVLVETGIAEQRKAAIEASWFMSDEAKFLSKMGEKEKNLFVQMYLDMNKDVDFIVGARDEAQAAVDNALRKSRETGDKVNDKRLQAQQFVEQAEAAQIDATGLPIGQKIPGTTTVDKYGAEVLIPSGKPGDTPMVPVRNKKTGEVKLFETDKAYMSGDEMWEPMIDDVDVIRTPDELRSIADTILSGAERTGPYSQADEILGSTTANFPAVRDEIKDIERIARRRELSPEETARLDELRGVLTQRSGTSNSIESVTRRYEERIAAIEDRIANLKANGGTKRQLQIANTQLANTRIEMADAITTARGTAGAVDEFLSAQEGFTVVPGKTGAKLQPTREMQAYNSAVQTAEEWAVKNKETLAASQASWAAKSKQFELGREVVAEIQRAKGINEWQVNFRFGSFAEYWDQVFDQRNLVESLQRELAQVNDLITKMPSKKAQEILARAAKGSKKQMPKPGAINQAMSEYRKWMTDNKSVFEQLGQEPNNPVFMSWAAAAQADADLIYLNLTKRQELERLVLASTPEWATRVVQPFADEWEKVAKKAGLLKQSAMGGERFADGRSTGFPGLIGNREALELLDNIAMIRQPGVVQDLSRFMRGYTGFFRAYATLSPGFHVRNGISNVFSLFSAGVTADNMFEGFRMWRLLDSELANGGTVDKFIAKLPAEKREIGLLAAQTMLGFGGGRTMDAMDGFIRAGNKITDNVAIQTSRKVGNKVESSAHFIMAYDALMRGYTADQAFNRSKRFLVDYQTRTILDETMRDIIPFWMWMSRNLPLQVMNRWANPKPYLVWDKLQKNFSESEEEGGSVIPQYLRDKNAINLGGRMFFSPELPFSGVDAQIASLSQPRKLMSYVNPGIRAPLEFLMNSDSYTGKPFSNKYQKVDGAMLPFLPMLQAMGQVSYDSEGNPVIDDRAASLLTNMIPPLSRAERLLPGGSGGSNALAGFLGSPFTRASEGSISAEEYRRLAALQQIESQQRAIEGAG
jgi:hypothetical protein